MEMSCKHSRPSPTGLPERCTPNCPEHKECALYVPRQGRRGRRIRPEEGNVCVDHCGPDLVDRLTNILEFGDGTVANLNIVPMWT